MPDSRRKFQASEWRLRETFGIEQMVMIGDRGMISKKAIAEMHETDGVGWIAALKSASIRVLVEQAHLQLGLIQKRVQAGKSKFKGRDRIGVCVGKVVNRYKVAKHFGVAGIRSVRAGPHADSALRSNGRLQRRRKPSILLGCQVLAESESLGKQSATPARHARTAPLGRVRLPSRASRSPTGRHRPNPQGRITPCDEERQEIDDAAGDRCGSARGHEPATSGR